MVNSSQLTLILSSLEPQSFTASTRLYAVIERRYLSQDSDKPVISLDRNQTHCVYVLSSHWQRKGSTVLVFPHLSVQPCVLADCSVLSGSARRFHAQVHTQLDSLMADVSITCRFQNGTMLGATTNPKHEISSLQQYNATATFECNNYAGRKKDHVLVNDYGVLWLHK